MCWVLRLIPSGRVPFVHFVPSLDDQVSIAWAVDRSPPDTTRYPPPDASRVVSLSLASMGSAPSTCQERPSVDAQIHRSEGVPLRSDGMLPTAIQPAGPNAIDRSQAFPNGR